MRSNKNEAVRIIYILLAVIAVEVLLLALPLKRRSPPIVSRPKEKARIEERGEAVAGRIAIVLDDWGYNPTGLKALEGIKEPLTLAILPNLNYSARIASRAKELGKEIILHLPLEPYKEQYYRLEPNTVLVDMPKIKVLNILRSDFVSLPGVSGISNHMGSKATEDKALMAIIFGELKKRRLYFLDSFTSRTICKELAASMGVPYAHRHVFLDNKSNSEYILSQLEVAARIARQQGAAVAIGHCRPKTLEVLSSALPEYKKQGFKFIYVSELVK